MSKKDLSLKKVETPVIDVNMNRVVQILNDVKPNIFTLDELNTAYAFYLNSGYESFQKYIQANYQLPTGLDYTLLNDENFNANIGKVLISSDVELTDFGYVDTFFEQEEAEEISGKGIINDVDGLNLALNDFNHSDFRGTFATFLNDNYKLPNSSNYLYSFLNSRDIGRTLFGDGVIFNGKIFLEEENKIPELPHPDKIGSTATLQDAFTEWFGDEKKHNHYFKECPYDYVDVYRIIELFDITDPCIQHAIKKLLVAGGRGHKDINKDVQDVIDSLVRWQDMRREELAINR